jgi:hypothetical protein
MKKILLAAALLVGVSFTTFAQSTGGGNRFSIGLEGGVPVGDAADIFNAVIGGSIKFEAPIATSTSFTLSAGYTSFLGKTIDVPGFSGKYESYGAIPIKAGIKYHVNEGFYVEGQLGAAIGTKSNSKVAFAYAPGIGYDFGGGVDIGVRYEGWSTKRNDLFNNSYNTTLGQVAARLAFSF